MPRKRKGPAGGRAEESNVNPASLAQIDTAAKRPVKVVLRRARGGDCWFVVVDRDRETIFLAVNTATLKSLKRFQIAGLDQATRMFFREEWRAIRAQAEGFCFMTTARNEAARFLLTEAAALGIRVGSNGDDLVMVAPFRIPRESRRTFETALETYRDEVIEILMQGDRS